MNAMSFRPRAVMALPLVIGLSACADEPTLELDAARQSVDAASAAAAPEYAPEAMEPLVVVQMELDTEMAAQAERFAPMRSYDRARQLADSLKQLADAATTRANEARAEAQRSADSLMVTLAAELAATRTAVETAPRGKGSAADLAALTGDLDGLGTVLEEARGAYAASDYRGALTKLEAVRTGLEGVRQHLAGGRTAAMGGTF